MRNRHNNNAVETNTSQNELNSLTQEVKELVKKRDFDEFAMTQVRSTTQLFNKLRKIEEDIEEMDSRQKAFLDSIKENIDSVLETLDSFNNINNNNLLPSSSSSPPKILYTVLTKKMSSLHKRAKLIEDGVLHDNGRLDVGLIYNLNARFTDDRNELVTEAYVKAMEEEYKIQDEGVSKYIQIILFSHYHCLTHNF